MYVFILWAGVQPTLDHTLRPFDARLSLRKLVKLSSRSLRGHNTVSSCWLCD